MRTYGLIIYNFFRVILKKMQYGKCFDSSWIQRISPNASMRCFSGGHIVLGENLDISKGCDIQAHNGALIEIGDRVYMNRYCMISAQTGVKIGKGCLFGPGVKMFDNNHKFTAKEGVGTGLSCGKIIIGENCWIASNVIILKNVHIGDNCVIGAGCIISRDIKAGSVVRCKQNITIEEIHS